MGVLSNKIDMIQSKPGDHIYSWRKAYLFAHHGIYVNERNVIHLTTGERQQTGMPTFINRLFTSSVPSFDTNNIPCPICSDCDETRTNGVILSCLDCFLSGGELYLFLYGVKTGLQVIINDSVGGGSGQATSYLAAAKSVAFASVRLAARYYNPTLVGCIMYSFKKLVSDIGYREDVTKVPVERVSMKVIREN